MKLFLIFSLHFETMQRSTSMEPILCNCCWEETRSFYRNQCYLCKNDTCFSCLENLYKTNIQICKECFYSKQSKKRKLGIKE